MPLRLVNKQRTHEINACDTKFLIVSMSIGEKEKLCNDLQNMTSEDGAFDRLLDIVAPAITQIVGYNDSSVRETLDQLEDIRQLREIIQAVIAHCGLTTAEAKNSPSSSEQPIPASAGNAAKPVVSDDEPALTTPIKTDS